MARCGVPRASIRLGRGYTLPMDDRDARRSTDHDAVIEAYKKDVDRTLLRENLKRTVDERVRNLAALQRFAEKLREAGRKR